MDLLKSLFLSFFIQAKAISTEAVSEFCEDLPLSKEDLDEKCSLDSAFVGKGSILDFVCLKRANELRTEDFKEKEE